MSLTLFCCSFVCVNEMAIGKWLLTHLLSEATAFKLRTRTFNRQTSRALSPSLSAHIFRNRYLLSLQDRFSEAWAFLNSLENPGFANAEAKHVSELYLLACSAVCHSQCTALHPDDDDDDDLFTHRMLSLDRHTTSSCCYLAAAPQWASSHERRALN